jgi:hypothetical protein
MRSVSLFANGSTRFDKNKIVRRSPPVRLRRGGTERNNPTLGAVRARRACARDTGDECAVPMTLPLDQCDNVAGDPDGSLASATGWCYWCAVLTSRFYEYTS